MIDALAQTLGFPYAMLLIAGVVLVMVAIICDGVRDYLSRRSPVAIKKIPPLHWPILKTRPRCPGKDHGERAAQLEWEPDPGLDFPVSEPPPAAYMSHWRLATPEETVTLRAMFDDGELENDDTVRVTHDELMQPIFHKLIKRVPVTTAGNEPALTTIDDPFKGMMLDPDFEPKLRPVSDHDFEGSDGGPLPVTDDTIAPGAEGQSSGAQLHPSRGVLRSIPSQRPRGDGLDPSPDHSNTEPGSLFETDPHGRDELERFGNFFDDPDEEPET